jgi:hypothetical protein
VIYVELVFRLKLSRPRKFLFLSKKVKKSFSSSGMLFPEGKTAFIFLLLKKKMSLKNLNDCDGCCLKGDSCKKMRPEFEGKKARTIV